MVLAKVAVVGSCLARASSVEREDWMARVVRSMRSDGVWVNATGSWGGAWRVRVAILIV